MTDNLNARVEETPYLNTLNVRWTEETLQRFVSMWNANRVRNEEGDIVTLSFQREGDDVMLMAHLPYGHRAIRGSRP